MLYWHTAFGLRCSRPSPFHQRRDRLRQKSNTLFFQTLPLTEDRYYDLVSTLLSRLFRRLVQPVEELAETVVQVLPLALDHLIPKQECLYDISFVT